MGSHALECGGVDLGLALAAGPCTPTILSGRGELAVATPVERSASHYQRNRMHTRTNPDRARDMQRVLQMHAVLAGNDPFEEIDALVTDLLTDLLHLCGAEGIDFHDQLATAEMHYREEMAEEAEAQR